MQYSIANIPYPAKTEYRTANPGWTTCLIDGTSKITYESVCGKCYLEKSGKIKPRGRV